MRNCTAHCFAANVALSSLTKLHPHQRQLSILTMRSQKVPSPANTNHILPVRLSRVISQERGSEPPPTQLLKAVSQLTLYRMQERANQYLAEGQTDDASRFMKNLATHLFSQDQHDLARTALAEANNILHKQRLSETGKKRIKYGTRALLLPSGYPGQSDSPLEEGSTP